MIKVQYYILTVIQFRATIVYDSAPLHALAFLLFTMQSLPLKHLSPRTRRKSRKPFPLMRLLHNSRTPRGWGAPVFLRELRALCVKINPLVNATRSVRHSPPSTYLPCLP
jgi:hypothetical protein